MTKPMRSVVLIDEVDKAPRDLPNDILHELESLEFTVREAEGYALPGRAGVPALRDPHQQFRKKSAGRVSPPVCVLPPDLSRPHRLRRIVASWLGHDGKHLSGNHRDPESGNRAFRQDSQVPSRKNPRRRSSWAGSGCCSISACRRPGDSGSGRCLSPGLQHTGQEPGRRGKASGVLQDKGGRIASVTDAATAAAPEFCLDGFLKLLRTHRFQIGPDRCLRILAFSPTSIIAVIHRSWSG